MCSNSMRSLTRLLLEPAYVLTPMPHGTPVHSVYLVCLSHWALV